MFRTFWQKIREPYRSEERKITEYCILFVAIPILFPFFIFVIILNSKDNFDVTYSYDTYYAQNLELTYKGYARAGIRSKIIKPERILFFFQDHAGKKYTLACEDKKCQLPSNSKGAEVIGENIHYFLYNDDKKGDIYSGYLLSGSFYLKDKPQHQFEIMYNPNKAYTYNENEPLGLKFSYYSIVFAVALFVFALPIPIIFRLKFDFSYSISARLAFLFFCIYMMVGKINERQALLAQQEKATDIIARKTELPDTTRYHYIPAEQFEGRPRYSHVKFDYEGQEYTVLCGMMKEFLDEALCDDKEKILSGKQVVFFENNKTNTGLLLNAELKDDKTGQEYHIQSNQEDIDHFLFSQFYYSKQTVKSNIVLICFMILGVIWSVISIFRLCLKTYKGDEI